MPQHFDLRDILFPSRCIGCRVLSVGLCSNCSSQWRFTNIESRVGALKVFSSLPYTKVSSHILLASKEDGIRQADELMISALRNSFENLLKSNLSGSVLVPIPSADRANRKRGRAFMAHLAEQLSKGESLTVWNLLEHQRKVVDQTRLSVLGRRANLAGAMRIAGSARMGRGIILVDDLVTTGATLSEAVRTLQARGTPVVGAITAFLAHPIR